MTFLAVFTDNPDQWFKKIRKSITPPKLIERKLENFTAIIGGDDWLSSRRSFIYHSPVVIKNFRRADHPDPLPIIAIKLQERSAYIGRDFLGFHPLYFSEDSGTIFSSRKSILWELGYRVSKVHPSEVLEIRRPGRIFDSKKRYVPPIIEEEEKKKRIAMEKRIFGKLKTTISRLLQKVKSKKVTIAFSGGVDSTLIALATSEVLDKEIYLVTVGKEGSHDRKMARKSYRKLEEECKVHHIEIDLSKQKVKRNLSTIIKRIESPNPLLLEIALPFFFIGKKMEKIKADLSLAGQGADELFFGYHKYVRANNHIERLKIEQRIMKNMARRNLCRDFKIFYPRPVFFPYLSKNMISLAAKIAPEFKINKKSRKKPIRQTLRWLGYSDLANKKKKALQYGSGAKEILTHIAKKRGLTGLTELAEKEFKKVFTEIEGERHRIPK